MSQRAPATIMAAAAAMRRPQPHDARKGER